MQRCIRDLVALHALPSMCVGRSPDDALNVLVDAVPTALHVDLVYLVLPGPPPSRRGTLAGDALLPEELDVLDIGDHADGADAVLSVRDRTLWCTQIDVPLGQQHGRLVLGRFVPLDAETDRVLFRSAANVIGSALLAAYVLDAARRKDDFIAMLGHELRNPLASILTAVELLGRQASASRERDVIERHTRHLSRLVDDLLDVTRITRGHIELRREPVVLRSILDRAVDIATSQLRQNQHRLVREGDETAIVDGDAVRLTQVFVNLLTNASKFSPRGEAIAITTKIVGDRTRVAIKDPGRGIARENLARIFEPFVQVDRAHEATSQGLGLGLAIVRMLVERHGGAIAADSEGLGRGSTFTVELPIATSMPVLHPAAPSPSRHAARSSLRVLIVDDAVDIADLLCTALSLDGFDVAADYDAQAALARWESFRPEVAVLDVGLPGMDGYELARAIRKKYGSEPYLVAATGYGQADDRKRALEAGFDLHLVKPVGIDDLARIFDERLARSSAEDVTDSVTSAR